MIDGIASCHADESESMSSTIERPRAFMEKPFSLACTRPMRATGTPCRLAIFSTWSGDDDEMTNRACDSPKSVARAETLLESPRSIDAPV